MITIVDGHVMLRLTHSVLDARPFFDSLAKLTKPRPDSFIFASLAFVWNAETFLKVIEDPKSYLQYY